MRKPTKHEVSLMRRALTMATTKRSISGNTRKPKPITLARRADDDKTLRGVRHAADL